MKGYFFVDLWRFGFAGGAIWLFLNGEIFLSIASASLFVGITSFLYGRITGKYLYASGAEAVLFHISTDSLGEVLSSAAAAVQKARARELAAHLGEVEAHKPRDEKWETHLHNARFAREMAIARAKTDHEYAEWQFKQLYQTVKILARGSQVLRGSSFEEYLPTTNGDVTETTPPESNPAAA